MSEAKPISWSYSSLTAFETCPLRFYLTRVTKEVADPPGEAAKWGTEAHKHLELRVTENKPLPEGLTHMETMMAKIINTPHDEIAAERQYCFNKDFELVEWFAKDAWCRGVVDLQLVKGRRALILDHKTGKRKPDSEQLQLFAALVMTAIEKIDEVTTGFLWLKDKRIDKETFTRDDVPQIWQNFLARVARVEHAHATGKWLPNPSGLCKAWCPCTKARCSFSGRS